MGLIDCMAIFFNNIFYLLSTIPEVLFTLGFFLSFKPISPFIFPFPVVVMLVVKDRSSN
jgi:hypothetical protein